MTRDGWRLAEASADLVGTKFRLGGWDAATGVDCVGLIVAALNAIDREVGPLPHYVLRQTDIASFVALASSIGLLPSGPDRERGDILLLKPSPIQHHLAICGMEPGTIIHAHAGLRRVTTSWLPKDWAIERSWRLA